MQLSKSDASDICDVYMRGGVEMERVEFNGLGHQSGESRLSRVEFRQENAEKAQMLAEQPATD